jgi:hypothetical protein
MARIVVLSDIHLSPTHGFFWENWCVARESAEAAKADAVIVNGDLAINGPDSDDEIAFSNRAGETAHARHGPAWQPRRGRRATRPRP